MTSERFVKFLDKILKGKKNKLIILDNGGIQNSRSERQNN